MTDSPSVEPHVDTWDGMLATLRRRYPGQKDSVLFCLNKLQQNPELTLRDFRDEAKLYGIPMAGRALHSARLLLGLVKAEPTAETKAAAPVTRPETAGRRPRSKRAPEPDDGGASIENKVMEAVRQIQSAAGAESEQLRQAVRQAIAILQRALG